MNIIEGQLIAQDLKIAIVVARFNEFIGSKLVGGDITGLSDSFRPPKNAASFEPDVESLSL